MKGKVLVNIYDESDFKVIQKVGETYYTCSWHTYINKETLQSKNGWYQYRFATEEDIKLYNKIQTTRALNDYKSALKNLREEINKMEHAVNSPYLECNTDDLFEDILSELKDLKKDLEELKNVESE